MDASGRGEDLRVQRIAAGGGVELSVLVPCFNAEARAARLLPTLVAAAAVLDASAEVIVVDNGSTDETASVAAAVDPLVQVVRLWPNQGASGARNAAAREARARWLLLCDDDVELTAEALATLWAARRPGYCFVPLVRDLQGALQNAIVSRWRLGDHKLLELPDPVDEVAYPLGACLLVERDLYWAVGGFDERYQPNGYEDVAFGFALRAQGAVAQMVPEATVRHHIHGGDTPHERAASFSDHRERYRERLYRNRWLFALLVLRGGRRWMVVGLGVPRTLLESCRERSPGPALGYVQAWRTYLTDLIWGGTRRRRTPR